jgi:hypothetical protein
MDRISYDRLYAELQNAGFEAPPDAPAAQGDTP